MMHYSWGRQAPAYHDKVFERKTLPLWDDCWQRLSPAARRALLDTLKIPARGNTRTIPTVPADRLPAPVLQELVSAGFVTVEEQGTRARRDQVAVVKAAVGFGNRMRCLRRYHLLTAYELREFERYVQYCFAAYGLNAAIQQVLNTAGLGGYALRADVYQTYVTKSRWPRWVAQYLNDSLAESVLSVLEASPSPLTYAQLVKHLPGHNADDVRAIVEKLIVHLALVEDLSLPSLDLVVGLLPAVREDLAQSLQPRERPSLTPCPTPGELGPEGGIEVPDLRAFLLELAAGPARLKQNHTLFQKEVDRFLAVFDLLPDWLAEWYPVSPESRLNSAGVWARRLKLVNDRVDGDHWVMELAPAGQAWLAAPLQGQYAQLYEHLREPKPRDDYFAYYSPGDTEFLGCHISATRGKKSRRSAWDDWEYEATLQPKERQPLRDAVYTALQELPVGVFHRQDSFLAHATFGPHNPVLLGLNKEEVTVRDGGRPVAPLDEQLEEAGSWLLEELLTKRLIPLGGVQVGRAEDGGLLIARRPRLDAYFGKAPSTDAVPAAEAAASRVVVQPDFTIVIIGLNPAPAAELAPFCERAPGRPGQGAMILKLTRDSVVKAVTNGLPSSEILERLQRHSATPLPENVLHEVRDWCDWVRTVPAASVTLFRCPDRATADRVQAALGRHVERLNETTIAFDEARLPATETKKLLGQGIIVKQDAVQPKKPASSKRRKRRWH